MSSILSATLLACVVAFVATATKAQSLDFEPLLSKFNIRTAATNNKDWEGIIWTDGKISRGFPPMVIRLTKKNGRIQNEDMGIDLSVAIFKISNKKKEHVKSVSGKLKLSELAVPGGYYEVEHLDDGTIIEKEQKYVGKPGTQETLIKDMFSACKESEFEIPPGSYVAKIRVKVNGGAEMEFSEFPFRVISTIAPRK
jgi:hypothetical protein